MQYLRDRWYQYPLLDRKVPVLTPWKKHATSTHSLTDKYRYSLLNTWYRYSLLDMKVRVHTLCQNKYTASRLLTETWYRYSLQDRKMPVLSPQQELKLKMLLLFYWGHEKDIVIPYCDNTVGMRTTKKIIFFFEFRISYIHPLRHSQ